MKISKKLYTCLLIIAPLIFFYSKFLTTSPIVLCLSGHPYIRPSISKVEILPSYITAFNVIVYSSRMFQNVPECSSSSSCLELSIKFICAIYLSTVILAISVCPFSDKLSKAINLHLSGLDYTLYIRRSLKYLVLIK